MIPRPVRLRPIELPEEYRQGLLGMEVALATADLRDGKIGWQEYQQLDLDVQRLLQVDEGRRLHPQYEQPEIIPTLRSGADLERTLHSGKILTYQVRKGTWIVPMPQPYIHKYRERGVVDVIVGPLGVQLSAQGWQDYRQE